MANPVELSHKSHTNGPKSDPLLLNRVAPGAAALDLATEFQELIAEHHKLSRDYATLLARFPGPIPEPQPAVAEPTSNGTLRFVAVKVTKRGLRRLSGRGQAVYAKSEARRCSLLAVHQPFVRVYWRPDGAGPAHKAVNEWRARFGVLMRRLRRLYRALGRRAQPDPEDFPLLRADGANCGISGADILEAIQRHVEHLADDLNLERKAGLDSALSDGLGARLRAARVRKGDTQQNVAEILRCDVATISRIETGRQRPDQYRAQLEEYIQHSSK
jgi:DNA-binding XRE family transcriptional regulator